MAEPIVILWTRLVMMTIFADNSLMVREDKDANADNPSRVDGLIVKETRLAKHMTVRELAARVGCTEQTITRIEAGLTKQSKYAPLIKAALGIEPMPMQAPKSLEQLSKSTEHPSNLPLISPKNDLPLYVTVGRSDPDTYRILPNPVALVSRPGFLMSVVNAYSLINPNDEMEPEFSTGDNILVDPNLEPKPGRSHIFYARNGGVKLRRLLAIGDVDYVVTTHRRLQGKEADCFHKDDYFKVHLIVGRHMENSLTE